MYSRDDRDEYYDQCQLVVAEAYRKILNRSPDMSGGTYYTTMLADGRITEKDLYNQISTSDEVESKIRKILFQAIIKKFDHSVAIKNKVSKLQEQLGNQELDFEKLMDIIRFDCGIDFHKT